MVSLVHHGHHSRSHLGDDVCFTYVSVPEDNSVFEGRSFDSSELLFCECLTR